MNQPWERLKGESSKAYHAFCIYRDLGPDRSIDKAMAQAGKKNRRTWADWSRTFNWVERAQAYDDYVEQEKRKEKEKEIMDMARRHATLAMAFQEKVAKALQSIDPSELSPRDLPRWLEVATTLERLSRGEPTEIEKQLEPLIIRIVDDTNAPDNSETT
mgnify:CR=1 FL=1